MPVSINEEKGVDCLPLSINSDEGLDLNNNSLIKYLDTEIIDDSSRIITSEKRELSITVIAEKMQQQIISLKRTIASLKLTFKNKGEEHTRHY